MDMIRHDWRIAGRWFLCSAIVVSMIVLANAGVASEVRTPDPDAEANRLSSELAEARRTSVALSKAIALERLGSYRTPKAQLQLLEETAEASADPLVAFRLRRKAARVRLNVGDFSHGYDGMEGPLGDEGCLTSWRVVGPFDNDNMAAFDRRLAPERGEEGPYEGKQTEIAWRELPDFDRRCVYRLGNTIQPSTAAVTYLATTVRADRDATARLLVGADGAYKIWVNGELVGREETNLGLSPDNQAWQVNLKEGKNRVLVKLASKSSGTLGFVGRLVGPNLAPLDGVEVAAEWSGETVEPSKTVPEESRVPEPTGEGVRERARSCSEEGEGSEAAWCTWLWRHVETATAAKPWRDEAERLVEPLVGPSSGGKSDASLSAADLGRLSELFERHGRRLDTVKAAAEMAPDDPWIALRLASVYESGLGASMRRKQVGVLESVLEEHPSFWPARLELATWHDSKGFSRKALEIVRDLEVSEKERRPEILRRLVDLEFDAGDRERARSLEKKLAAIRVLNGSSVWKRVDDRVSRNAVREALEIVRRQRKLHPAARPWVRKEAELLRVLGNEEEALAVLDAMIEKRPGDLKLRRHKASFLVAFDRTDEAIALLERALELGPRNKSLRDFLAHLQPEREDYHEPWMIDDVRGVAAKHPAGSYSYDTVVDQTIVHVEPNGLSKQVSQRVDRAITNEGVEDVRYHSVSYTRGDERVDVLDVKVHKSDGTVLEGYDVWRGGRSKKSGPYYNDRRRVHIRANNVEKGDLVEFRYRVREIANENFRGDYFGDISYVQSTRPIAFSRYAVEAPSRWELYFREPSLEHDELPNQLPGGEAPPEGYEISGFELTEVPAIQTDPRQPGHADVYDYVLVSNKETWDEVGEWWWNLIEEQLIVDQEIAAKVAELTAELDGERAKLEAIHDFVVKKTRYLHVGLGIHGWKPYRTTQCFQNQYGDCKDKSSLMKVMLEEAGIDAHLVLVRTRRLGAVDDYPASMHIFNHAIVYVPSMDLYLDPTAEFNGTRELTPMDQGAQALIVRDGGETRLTTLPVDESEDNVVDQELEIDLSVEPPVATGQIVAYGQNAVHYRKKLEDSDRRDEAFEKELAETYSGADLVSARYENLGDLEEPVEIHFEFRGGRLKRSNNGREYVFPYGAPKDLQERFADRAERNRDLTIRVPFVNETNVRFRPPSERGFEGVPEPVEIEGEYGSFRMSFEREGRTLVAEIRYSIDVQRVPVEDYAEFRRFLSKVTSALDDSIELTDETTN